MSIQPCRQSADSNPVWVFGYGSLIWNPGFEHEERTRARVRGHARRFWQASHDHRGTPERPGRVVTLVPLAQDACEGMAYRLPVEWADSVLAQLDEREQDGYQRECLQAELADGRQIPCITWIADERNPSWVGERTLTDMARQIAERSGPSGSNSDYVLTLADHLEQMRIADSHVQELAAEVRRIVSVRR